MCETNNEIFLGFSRVRLSLLKAKPKLISTESRVAATKVQSNKLTYRLLRKDIPEKTNGITKSGITFLITLTPVLRSEVHKRAIINSSISAIIGFKTG